MQRAGHRNPPGNPLAGQTAGGSAAPPTLPTSTRRSAPNLPSLLICLGASTGGIEVLERVLPDLVPPVSPVLIVQHIIGDFAPALARRLSVACGRSVVAATDGMPVHADQVILAVGNTAHLQVHNRGGLRCRMRATDKVMGHRPSIDVLFLSAASTGLPVIAALLTGMGSDGAQGLLRIRQCGGRTIAQDAASSKVFGMPRRAIECGAAEFVLPAERIGQHIAALSREIEIGTSAS